jgi:hypothetical protein
MMVQETKELVIVDLEYEVSLDKEEKSITFKFTNFDDSEQMEKFKTLMIDHLPLMLFTSDVKH